MRAFWVGALVAGLGCGEREGNGAEGVDRLEWSAHERAPSLAVARWRQAEPGEVWVEYSFDEGEWLRTPARERAAGEHEALVVGIPMGVEARWRVVTEEASVEADAPIQTEPPPTRLPVGTVVTSAPDRWLPEGRYLLTSISQTQGGWSTNGPFFTVIYDRQGRPVWSQRTDRGEWTLYPQVSYDRSHLIIDEFGYFGSEASAIRTYLDEEIARIPMTGHHHAFVELPGGTLAWASWFHGSGAGEALVEKAPGQIDETIVWDCEKDWPKAAAVDAYGCASNCLYYDEGTDSYLYSFYSNESVVSIDRATGTTEWWAGGVPGGFSFAPASSQFYWQHGVSWTKDGTLLVSTYDGPDEGPSRTTNLAREYEVDAEAGTLTEVWSYDAGVYVNTNGDTWRLANGNTLHTLGSASEIKEVDENGETVWHLDFEGTRLLGRSEWIEDLYTLVSP